MPALPATLLQPPVVQQLPVPQPQPVVTQAQVALPITSMQQQCPIQCSTDCNPQLCQPSCCNYVVKKNTLPIKKRKGSKRILSKIKHKHKKQ